MEGCHWPCPYRTVYPTALRTNTNFVATQPKALWTVIASLTSAPRTFLSAVYDNHGCKMVHRFTTLHIPNEYQVAPHAF